MFYFQVRFKDPDADIYIVRVEDKSLEAAKRKARRIIEKTILNTGDFEIKELTLEDLLSQCHFVDDIAPIIRYT